MTYQRIARRYILAAYSPDTLWAAWVNIQDLSLGRLLNRLAEIQTLASGNRKVTQAYLRVKALSDNLKALDREYGPKLRTFKGQKSWTPELEVLAKELAGDRKLGKRLDMEVPTIEDSLSEGLFDYFKSNLVPDTIVDKMRDSFMREEPSEILAHLQKFDFRKDEAILQQAVKLFPELKNILHDPTYPNNPGQYRAWVRRLESAVGNEKAFFSDWEDNLPGWSAQTLVENIDLSFADERDTKSPLAWYEVELQGLKRVLRSFK